MGLTGSQRFAYRLLGARAEAHAVRRPRLGHALERAHVPLRPAVYLSMQWLSAALVFGAALTVVGALLALWATGRLAIPFEAVAVLVPLPLALAVAAYHIGLVLPELRAAGRARDIDARLPHALHFIATLADAGTQPPDIFRSLARQPLYREVANEAAWIVRDIDRLGSDLPSALHRAMARTPSERFQDFLQGTVSALGSGADLAAFFLAKSEQFLADNKQDQRRHLEGLGVLAESFVVVVVAAPLFLIILLTVMASLGSDARDSLRLGYMLVLVLLPLAQLGFATAVKSGAQEA
ncbi:MAG: type II secretion system F family protein [Thermoplasmatota archaeon]